jgi:aminoethylphosphonate catabolism LysR family transcriptional regulator
LRKPINLNRLRSFVAIAEARSFGGAAKLLGVSQPTLSLQLAQLEEEFGVRLIHRPARNVGLTATGSALLEAVQPLALIEQRALALLSDARELERGQLRIAADAPQHVLAAMARFASAHPHVALSLSTGNSTHVIEQIARHEADIAVVADVDKHASLTRKLLHRDRVVLVVARAHPWGARHNVSPQALGDQTLIEREPGSRTRAIMRRALDVAGVVPRASIELGSREAVLEAAELGLGVGCVFESEIGTRELRRIVLRGADTSATEYAVFRRSRRHESAIAAFAGALREAHGC